MCARTARVKLRIRMALWSVSGTAFGMGALHSATCAHCAKDHRRHHGRCFRACTGPPKQDVSMWRVLKYDDASSFQDAVSVTAELRWWRAGRSERVHAQYRESSAHVVHSGGKRRRLAEACGDRRDAGRRAVATCGLGGSGKYCALYACGSARYSGG